MNNIESAKLPQGGARQLVRRSLARRPDPDALMNTAYRRPSANPRCALLIFIVLAASSSVHAQSTGIFVNSNNNVGIGTTSPNDALTVSGSGTTKIGLNGGSYSGNELRAGGAAGNMSAGYQIYSGTGLDLNLFTDGGSNGVTIKTGNGNVGIGTTSPNSKVQVNGGLEVGTYGSNRGVPLDVRTGAASTYTFAVSRPGSDVEALVMSSDSNERGLIGTNNADTQLGSWLSNIFNPYVTILNSSGNVGIGTTSPTQTLQVNGTQSIINTNDYNGATVSLFGVGRNTVVGDTYLSIGTNQTNHYGLVQAQNAGLGYYNLLLNPNGGNVGIGTTTPGYALDVAGQVHASSFVSSTQTYADFVFKPGYKLEPLSDVEASIQKDGHLPGIPSEAEAKANGIDLASMQVKLLQKIEELTLHQIEQQKLLENQNKRLDEQSQRIEQLEQENTELREKGTK
jgi:hypothetical protein